MVKKDRCPVLLCPWFSNWMVGGRRTCEIAVPQLFFTLLVRLRSESGRWVSSSGIKWSFSSMPCLRLWKKLLRLDRLDPSKFQ